MAGFKHGRITSDIQLAISGLLREVKDPRVSPLIGVVKVDVSGDLSYATIYVSAIDGYEATLNSVKGLKSAAGYLRRELGAQLRLRYTPELQFIADDSIAYGAHILEVLRDPTKVKPANPANENIVLEDE